MDRPAGLDDGGRARVQQDLGPVGEREERVGRGDRTYFAPRRPGSVWAASNKARVEGLRAASLMTPAGEAVIERAKADRSWTVFDSAERMEVPPDLEAALAASPEAEANFAALPPSARKKPWPGSQRRSAPRPANAGSAMCLTALRGRSADPPDGPYWTMNALISIVPPVAPPAPSSLTFSG